MKKMGVNMTCDIKWDKIFQWEYIDSHCCIEAFASDYGGKTNIIIIINASIAKQLF